MRFTLTVRRQFFFSFEILSVTVRPTLLKP